MNDNCDKFTGFYSHRNFELDVEKSNKAQSEGCSKDVSVDFDVFLPLDPFGMDLKSTVTAINLPVDPFGMDITVTTISDWIQELYDDSEYTLKEWRLLKECWFHEDDNNVFDGGLLASFDLGTVKKLQPEKGNLNFCAISTQDHSPDDVLVDSELKNVGFDPKYNIANWAVCDKGMELQDEGGDPHDALFFALGYLEVDELLVVERVCRSLRDAIRGDSLLWRSIHIYYPLCMKITDEALVKLTSRAQGTVKCLSLIQCINITDNGLKKVLESNPRLTKLCVPGCVRLSVANILDHLRVLKSAGTLRIKHLRIGNIGMLEGVTKKQFEELKSLLGLNTQIMVKANKAPFYGLRQQPYHFCNDDRALDIELCPKCQVGKIVYDCPAESCNGKDEAKESCRACSSCVARCSICGCCIKENYSLKEMLMPDLLCLVCDALVCDASSSGNTIIHRERRYKFCFLQ